MRLTTVTRAASQFFRSLSVILLVSVMASAYTVVMRGGRRIEIPAQFTVTKTALTYEVRGINVTLEMAAIDIPATERANNEQPGSLLKRAEQVGGPQTSAGPQALRPHGKPRTVTDRDLEPYRRARLESEAAYEKRRIELGLPSLEELRRRAGEETELARRELAERRSEEEQAESYWRARASELRTEIAATDAQINFVRARLSETRPGLATGSFTVVGNALFALGHSRFNPVFSPGFASRQGGFLAPTTHGRFGSVGGITGERAFINPIVAQPDFRGFAGPVFGVPAGSSFGSFYSAYDFGNDAPTLAAALDQLLVTRAGLEARMQALEDEARHAGVPPGWLR